MKHDELQEDLACHLRAGTDRMVWTNTQLGPVGSPRPDVFTVNKSFSRFASDAYEIKVSVSDLRSDVTSGKWQSYRKFAHRVWFAFPRGMAPLDLIPKECGVILRSDSGWRAARKPVAQVLDTLPRDAWLKLLMDLHPVNSSGHVKAPRYASDYTAAEIVRNRLGKEIGDLFYDVVGAKARLLARKAMQDAEAKSWAEERERRMKSALADTERTQVRLTGALDELGEALGLDADARTPSDLCAAIFGLRNRLQHKGIDRAIELLEALRGEVSEAA
jgi:hypothetical protein